MRELRVAIGFGVAIELGMAKELKIALVLGKESKARRFVLL